MESVADDRLHGLARFRCVPGLACALVLVAAAGPEPARAAASGSVLTLEENPSSKVLYLEESGGLITPVPKPPPGSAREPLAPLPARDAKAPAPRPPITRADPATNKAGRKRGD